MIKILSTHFRKITAVFLFTVLYSEHVMAAYIFIAKSSPVYTSAAGNSYDNLAVNNSGASFIRSSKGINNLYPGIDNRRKVQAQKDDITAENKITANKKADDIGGPDQPETQGFQSVNSNNMVDLFTGDFSYNIPLLDVGGYPVNIFYSSGISMDQEASWVGLGWNINPGTISRNMRGVPDDFNGEDKIIKDTYTKDNVTIGGSMTGDIEILGQPLPQPSGQSGSGSGDPEKKKIGTLTVGAFYNTYKGWGTEAGFATSILSGEKAAGPLGAGLSISDNSQNGITLNPSLGIKVAEFEKEDATTYKSTTFSAKAGLAYNSRSGLSSVQVSGGISYKSGLLLRGIAGLRSIYMFKEPIKIETKSTNQGFPLSASIDFASPTYSPSVSLPYRSIQVTFTLKPGGEGGGAHPDALLSGYVSTQSLAENERIIPAYGYLNSQNGAKDPNVLLDYNRDKEVIYRDKPAVNNIAIPSYTYDAFSISGEGTGGMFRAYRSDIGYVFDHRNDTKSESGSLALDLGVGAIVHGGTDINFTDAGSVTGPWTDNNPMGTTVAYKNYDANTPLFEPAYFRNPGEKSINDKDFYNRIGGDDVVTVGLAQNGIGPFISSTNRLDRYKDYKLIEGAQTMLSQANAFKQKRDKRTQVISYLTAEEAAAAGLNKTINSYSIDPATHKLKLLSAENRVDNNINTASYWRKKNHISEIDVLNSDGRRYVYGIPVYNKMQKEVTFAVAERHDDLGKGITAYTSNDNKMHNNNGQDEYYNTETTPSYAHSFLLTGILSSDYVDVTGDGVTPDDLGDGVKFNYTKTAGMSAPFKWRNPYCVKQSGITKGTYNEGLQTDNRDDKVSYIYGEKELWYLNSIESKTMIAVFTVENRDDLKSMQEDGTLENTSYAKRLKEINLYTRADFETLGDQAKPVKTVHFEYGYDLCKNVASDPAKGKLTLKKIWFTYNGLNKTAQHPYVFNYSNVNPSYNSLHSDKWGNYKNAETDNPNALTNAEYPYAIQDGTKAASNITAWTLTSIQLPSGGKMDITYESDDYAYIQNKRAMKMMNIAGFSNQKPTGTATSGSGADDIAGNRLYSKYGLISPLLQSNDKLYVTVKVPYNASDADEVYSKYFDGTDKMYFKLKVIMPSDSYGSGAEFIPCYAELDKGTSANPNYGTLGEGYIWFKIKGINLAGDGDGNYSPLAKAAIQFLRLNLPAKAYPGSETPDPMEPLDAVKVVSSMFTNMTQIFRPYDEIARQGDYASSVDLSRCFVRLTDPLYKKYGGGIRVKKITVTDNWLAMTNNNEPQSVYGQEYFYETTKTIDGAAKTISSGVATYEPMLGGEENPFRQPVEYTERISPLAPVTMGYAEEPYCETLFPAPMVGYSRVVVRSVNRGANIKSSNGSEETNFYTSYDFPVITDNSMLDVNTKKRYRTPLRSLIKIDAHHNLTMSQGFKIELNDMNGKIKSQASYSETDPDHPIAYSEYVYRTVDPNAEVKQLSNTVSTVNQNGDIDNASFIGEDIELMMDMREEHTFSFGVSFCPNLDLPAFWAFLSFVPMPQSEDNKFRSVATTKVIHRCGLLEKVIAIDKGSKVTTENLLYDSETGDVLLTKTANEFNDPIYNFTYPAHWAYSGMGPAYKNIGAKFGFNETTGYLNQAQAFDVTDGKAMAQSNGTLPSFIQYFESGDEILATGRIKNGETLDFPDCSGNQNCNGYNYSDNFTSQKVWAVDAGKIDPSANEGILFIDQYGNPYSAQDVTMKIIRSGRRNLLSASVGSVISMATPIRNNKIVFDDQTKVVTSGAGIFNDTWKVKDQVYLPPAEVKTVVLDPVDEVSYWRKFPYNENNQAQEKVFRRTNDNLHGSATETCDIRSGTGTWPCCKNTIAGVEWIPRESLDQCYSLLLTYKTLLKYDFSGIPDGATITDASIKLYQRVPIDYPFSKKDFECSGQTANNWAMAMSNALLPAAGSADATDHRWSIKRVNQSWSVTETNNDLNNYDNLTNATASSELAIDNPGNSEYNCTNLVKDIMSYSKAYPALVFSTTHENEYFSDVAGDNKNHYRNYYLNYGGKGADCYLSPKLMISYLQQQPACRSLVTGNYINPYTTGVLGNWRLDKSYVYYDVRKETDPLTTDDDIRKMGLIDGYSSYWAFTTNSYMNVAAQNANNNPWVWNSKTTLFNRRGFELENTDPLGRYNSGIYGYGSTLPTSVAQNSRYREQFFDGFEDYSYKVTDRSAQTVTNCGPIPRDLDFVTGVDSHKGTLENTQSHTGSYSLKVNASSYAQANFVCTNTGNSIDNAAIAFDLHKYATTLLSTETVSSSGDGLFNMVTTGTKWRTYLQPDGSGPYHIKIKLDGYTKDINNEFSWDLRIQSYGSSTLDFTTTGIETNTGAVTDLCLDASTLYLITIDIKKGTASFNSDFSNNIEWQKPCESNYTPVPSAAGHSYFNSGNLFTHSVTPNNITCPRIDGFTTGANTLLPVFSPGRGDGNVNDPALKYVFSAWVKEDKDCLCTSYTDNKVVFTFLNAAGTTVSTAELKPAGKMIEGWQRYESVIEVPNTAASGSLQLHSTAAGPVYFDDVRFFPYNGNMKSFVYDPLNLRLVAELDENNYASFYEYDDEGTLVRVKKETERGIKTIQETRSSLTDINEE